MTTDGKKLYDKKKHNFWTIFNLADLKYSLGIMFFTSQSLCANFFGYISVKRTLPDDIPRLISHYYYYFHYLIFLFNYLCILSSNLLFIFFIYLFGYKLISKIYLFICFKSPYLCWNSVSQYPSRTRHVLSVLVVP